MDKIGMISILTEAEINKKCRDLMLLANKKYDHKSYEFLNFIEVYDKSQKEPMPYKLFRLNEMLDYNINGVGCVITEEQYFDRLEQLPPRSFKKDIFTGYIIPECITEDIFEHIFEYENKYYCVIMSTGFKVV